MADSTKITKSSGSITIDVSDGSYHGLNDYFLIDKSGSDSKSSSSSSDIKLSIIGIHFKKQLYKPGHAQIEAAIINEPRGLNIESIMNAVKKYFMPEGDNTVKLTIKVGDKTPVKDYYLCDMSIENRKIDFLNDVKKKTEYKKVVTLHAYSPDYFLTLVKYNKTYLGKTLSEIIRTKVSGITGLGTFPAKADLCLCHTTSTSDNTEELKQPYLVQFDESFYDFVVRVAHRCGELFYYDDGKLMLGVDKTKLNATATDFKQPTALNLNPAKFSFSKLPDSAPKTVNEFSLSLITKNANDTEAVEDDGLYRSAIIANDDFLNSVTNDDTINQKDLWEPHWFELAHDAFQATSGFNALVAAAKRTVNILAKGAATSHAEDVQLTKDVIDSANELFVDTRDIDKKGKATIDKYKNLYNAFYNWIEEQEKISSESVQENLYNNTPPSCSLGECVTLSSDANADKYLVDAVECSITSVLREAGFKTESGHIVQTYSQQTDVKGKVSVFKLHTSSDSRHQLDYQKSVFPPLYDIPHIRKAKPQQAIVSNIADPLRMGRVQIRYPWSKEIVDAKKKTTKNASPWIAMTTPFTGNDHGGFLMTPNPGDYVIVDYEDGNVERPFVSGSLYKDKASAPWGSTVIAPIANKFNKPHRSITSGGNGITFVDGNAKNYLANLLPGIGGMFSKLYGQNDANLSESKLGGGLILSDWYGMYNISMSSASRSIDIDSPWGSVSMSAFTGIKINCPNGDIDIVGKNVNISAGNNLTLKSGTNIKKPGTSVGMDLGCSALSALGGALMGGISALASINSDANAVVSSIPNLVDCSFIRNVWEILYRPVDGSMELGSMRNIIMHSGVGNVNVPSDTLSNEEHANAKLGLKTSKPFIEGSASWSSAKDDAVADQCATVSGAFYYIAKTYMDVCRNYLDEVDRLVTKAKTFNVWPDPFTGRIKEDVNLTTKLFNEEELSDAIMKEVDLQDGDISNEWLYNIIKDEYGRRLDVLRPLKEIANLKDVIKRRTQECITSEIVKEQLKASLGIQNPASIDIGYDVADNYSLLEGNHLSLAKLNEFNEDKKNAILKKWSKEIVLKVATVANNNQKIGKAGIAEIKIDSIANLRETAKFMDAPKKYDTTTKLLTSLLLKGPGLSDIANYDSSSKEWKGFDSITKLLNINGKAGTRSLWEVGGQGSILLSANSAETIELGKDSGGWKTNPNMTKITMSQVLDKLGVTD